MHLCVWTDNSKFEYEKKRAFYFERYVQIKFCRAGGGAYAFCVIDRLIASNQIRNECHNTTPSSLIYSLKLIAEWPSARCKACDTRMRKWMSKKFREREAFLINSSLPVKPGCNDKTATRVTRTALYRERTRPHRIGAIAAHIVTFCWLNILFSLLLVISNFAIPVHGSVRFGRIKCLHLFLVKNIYCFESKSVIHIDDPPAL